MNPSPRTDVLVVGAGPTGLMAACELLRRGVAVRVVDRAPQPVPYSKALLLWPRSLELLEDIGALPAAREAGIPIRRFRYLSGRSRLADLVFDPDLVPLCLPQRQTERILTERLYALGGCVERGMRLLALDGVDFSGDPAATAGVTAILERPDGGVERATASWLIGADGAGSAVRGQLGLAFSGTTYAVAFGLVDCRIDGELETDVSYYYQSPAGAIVAAALPGGLFRFFASSTSGPPAGDLAAMQRVIDERGPVGVRLRDPEWESVFRVHRRQAGSFQLGRVFLAGDAGHVHSPAGGQGLNTGLGDANNLAWKLAAVVHGDAPPDLLRTYTTERHAVATQVVRDADLQTRAWMARSRAAVAGRDLAFRALGSTGVLRHYGPVLAGKRIRYPGGTGPAGRLMPLAAARRAGAFPAARPGEWVLLTGPAVDPDAASAVLRPGVRAVAATADALRSVPGRGRVDWVLVRPDHVVAAAGRAPSLAAAGTALDAHLGPADAAARPVPVPAGTA